MRHRSIRVLFILSALAIAAICANPAWAQSAMADKPPLYTYVAEWGIPRAMWADYEKNQNANNDPLNKAVADGTLISYGSYSVLNHQEGQATHGTWFSANSMANLMKVLESRRSAPAAADPILAASKHWDYILESRDYNAHSGTFTNGYLRVGYWRVKKGVSDPDGKIIRGSLVATLEKLLAAGGLHAYQIDEESVHSGDPNAFYVAIFTNGADGLDKFYAALDEANKTNPAGMAGYESMLDSSGHRDTLAHVGTMTHK
jgi:hypothetical protein